MSEREDRAYLLRRAREERDIASRCEDRAVALTHVRFADLYERRARDCTAPVGIQAVQPAQSV